MDIPIPSPSPSHESQHRKSRGSAAPLLVPQALDELPQLHRVVVPLPLEQRLQLLLDETLDEAVDGQKRWEKHGKIWKRTGEMIEMDTEK